MCLPLGSAPASSHHALTPSDNDKTPPSIVPTDKISQQAYAYAIQHLHPAILSHSLRVFQYAHVLSRKESSPWHSPGDRLPLLFVACLYHDIGTTSAHDGPQRFEVEGADAAVAFLTDHGVSEADAHEVWVAIALHDSPGLAERIAPLARLIRLAVKSDFDTATALKWYDEATVHDTETAFPRIEIEKILGDLVVEQALRQPDKAPRASWPGDLLRSKLENPDWDGPNKAF